jgi:hypothetical protein
LIYLVTCLSDPIGHCSVDLAKLRLSASVSVSVSVDEALQDVEHGRVQMEVQFGTGTGTGTGGAVAESLASGGAEVRILEESAGGEVKDCGGEEEKGSVVSSSSVLVAEPEELGEESPKQEDATTLEESTIAQDMSQLSLGDASGTEVDEEEEEEAAASRGGEGNSSSVSRTPPRPNAAVAAVAAVAHSYSSKAENDDVMMAMIRALQDEVEDWKHKYQDLKLAHDALVADTVSRPAPPVIAGVAEHIHAEHCVHVLCSITVF